MTSGVTFTMVPTFGFEVTSSEVVHSSQIHTIGETEFPTNEVPNSDFTLNTT